MLLIPNFDLQIVDLLILLSAGISFLALIFASKRVLFFLEISDFAISQQIKKDERLLKAKREKGKIRDSFFKVSQTKEEKKRRKELYKVKQKREESQKQKQKIRAENGRVINVRKRLEKQERPLAQRVPKAYAGKSSSKGKRSDRKEFMSKKYRETNFSNPLK